MPQPPNFTVSYLLTGGQGRRYHIVDPQGQPRSDTAAVDQPDAVSYCRRPGILADKPDSAEICGKCQERQAKAPPHRQPLPFEMEDICFEVTSERQVSMSTCGDFDQAVVQWRVEAHARNIDGVLTHRDIAVARLWTLDPIVAGNVGCSVFDILDSEDAEFSMIGEAICGPGGDLNDDLNCWGKLICLDRVRVEPAYRGHGIGPLLAGLSLDVLRGGCSLAICYPAPIESRPRGTGRAKARAELGRIWSKVGFEPYRDGVWIINLDSAGFEKALYELVAGASS